MTAFDEYEAEVVRLLVSRHMPEERIAAVLESATLLSYEHTGCGYFLTVRDPSLPSDRIVCDEPLIVGSSDDVQCGFVVFLEDGELTLECHFWGGVDVPQDFRQRRVEIKRVAQRAP